MNEADQAALRVEPAASADLAAIRALLEQAGLPTADVGEALVPGFVVLRDGQSVLGSAAVEVLGSCALLRSVAVAPGLQSRGYGAHLTVAAQELARSLGLAPLYLLTTTAADYFARRGFRRVERDALPAEVRASHEFSTLCPATAVAMVGP